jgi:hypothetical protein
MTEIEKNIKLVKKYVNKKGIEVTYTYNAAEYLKKFSELHNLSRDIPCPICGWTYKKYSEWKHLRSKHHMLAIEIMNNNYLNIASSSDEEESKPINILDEIIQYRKDKKTLERIAKNNLKLKAQEEELLKHKSINLLQNNNILIK